MAIKKHCLIRNKGYTKAFLERNEDGKIKSTIKVLLRNTIKNSFNFTSHGLRVVQDTTRDCLKKVQELFFVPVTGIELLIHCD
jgi:hypothetical protein